MSVPASILDYLDRHRDDLVGFLESLVTLETPSAEPESQDAALDLLESALRELGYRCRRLRSRAAATGLGPQLFARPVSRHRYRPVQLLLGHVDTVWPSGTIREMPFRQVDGRIHGPGIFDMKAGLTQMIFALRALNALRLDAAVTPVVLVNSDEEIGSRISTRQISRLARISDRAFVMEPSLGPDGKLKTSRKGVGRFEITVKGEAAHAGLDPGRGASAILELSHQIQRLFAMNDPERGISVNVGTIDGGLGANVVAPESRARVDVRVPTRDDAERIELAIQSLSPMTPGTQVIVEGGISRPPMEPSDLGRALWHRARDAADRLGIDLEEGAAGGGSDGNTTNQFTPTLDGLGAVGDGAHARHEHVRTSNLVERSALLALLLLEPPLKEACIAGSAP